jgi:hypothetical protein
MMMQRGETVDQVVTHLPIKTVNISNTSIKDIKSNGENKPDTNRDFKISSSKHFNFSQVGGARKMLDSIASNTLFKNLNLPKVPHSFSAYRSKNIKVKPTNQSWIESRKLSLPQIK